MIELGKHARELRDRKGWTQRAAADELGITNVHLCNIEGDKATPSWELLDRYQKVFGIDLYVYAWCQSGDVRRLPPRVREAAEKLTDYWKAKAEGI